ncbi:MAG: LysE family translocator [Gammaproteobacteria bacterium]|nr:LysE family translocator [Gammaproteobacteria bacterium]MDH3410881.1 LysE family translocator [Gammaproteobacteria bacterium]
MQLLPDATTLLIFLGASLVLLLTPGPAVFYIVARSIDQGRAAGVVSTLGVAAGSCVHIAAAALGISALLASSALAFNLVKLIGAAYLIYLGVRKFLVPDPVETDIAVEKKRLGEIFVQGVIVNVFNPKTALFFLAFLPQFVDLAKGQVALQMILLGVIFALLGILSDGAYAIAAGSFGRWLKSHAGILRAQRYFAGSVFITLGLLTAATGSGKK